MGLLTSAAASVTKAPFGKLPDGEVVESFTVSTSSLQLQLITFGARVISLKAPDRHGKMADVVLGYNNIDDYVRDTKTYFGAVPGRYANRIAKGQFTLDGKQYQLPINDPPNTLHGGPDGFDRHNWTANILPNGVEFTLVSPDGDEGFPGDLTAHVRYTLHGNTVRIEYSSTSDKPTVINLTNHAYFNLAGQGTVLDHQLTINADQFTPIDATSIPLGALAPVTNTPFEFRHPHTIGERISAQNEQFKNGNGYDHNFVVNGKSGDLRLAATAFDPATGRVLTVETTEPGVQFYSGNFLDGTFPDRSGGTYPQHSGFCLETQHYPNSPNQPAYPSTELRPGETYHSLTTWTLTTE